MKPFFLLLFIVIFCGCGEKKITFYKYTDQDLEFKFKQGYLKGYERAMKKYLTKEEEYKALDDYIDIRDSLLPISWNRFK